LKGEIKMITDDLIKLIRHLERVHKGEYVNTIKHARELYKLVTYKQSVIGIHRGDGMTDEDIRQVEEVCSLLREALNDYKPKTKSRVSHTRIVRGHIS
jgi:hypothetical protein